MSKFFRPRNVLTSLQFLIFVVASFFCLCVYHFLCFEGFFVCMCVFFFFIISFFITLALQSASVFFAQEYQTSFSSIITFFHSAFFSGIFLAKFLFFAFQKKCKLKLDWNWWAPKNKIKTAASQEFWWIFHWEKWNFVIFSNILLKQGKLPIKLFRIRKKNDAKQNSMVISCKEIMKTKIFVWRQTYLTQYQNFENTFLYEK